MNREQKEQAIQELRADLEGVTSVVVTNAAGIPVNTLNDLRGQLRATGGRYRVVKNTLARLAIKGTHLEALDKHLVGQSALVYNPDDHSGPAKILLEFQKKNDKFEIRGGALDGQTIEANGIEALSKMPGKNELRASLLAVFNGVGTKFVRTLAGSPQSILNLLNNRRDSLQ